MKREVLVVEDEQNVFELIRDVLEADGLDVRGAPTIAAARSYLETHAPDLLLLDVKLPDGDGLSLLADHRDAGHETPAIVITAFGTLDRAVSAMRSGASDFVVKPFDNERLRGAAAAALATTARLEETARPSRRPCSSRSCSGSSAGRSPARTPRRRGLSKPPTAEHNVFGSICITASRWSRSDCRRSASAPKTSRTSSITS